MLNGKCPRLRKDVRCRKCTSKWVGVGRGGDPVKVFVNAMSLDSNEGDTIQNIFSVDKSEQLLSTLRMSGNAKCLRAYGFGPMVFSAADYIRGEASSF